MKQLLILGTIVALTFATTAEARQIKQKSTRRVVTQRVVNDGTTRVAPARNRTVVRRSYNGGGYYSGGGGYYRGGGYYPYYSSGPVVSVGIGGGYGYPGYGYGYGYPYGYNNGYA